MKKILQLALTVAVFSLNKANATKTVHADDLKPSVEYFLASGENSPAIPISASQYELLSHSLEAHKSMTAEELIAVIGAQAGGPEDIRASLEKMRLFKTYSLTANGLIITLKLTASEYYLLVSLLEAQKPLTASEISLLLSQNQTEAKNVPELIKELNFKAEERLRRILVLENKKTYFLDREIPDYRGVQFQIPKTGRGLIYREHAVDLNSDQVKFLSLMDQSPDKLADFETLGKKMHWLHSIREKTQSYVAEINRRAIEDAGAPIAAFVPGQGARLINIRPLPLPEPLTVDTFAGPMTFESIERLIFETLELSSEPSAGILEVDENEFLKMGLSLADFNTGIKGINHKIFKLRGDILVRECHIQIRGEKFFSHFYRSGNSFVQRRRPTARDCWPWLVKRED